MAQRFDDEERRRIAAERLKASLTTDSATPHRRHWRDRWSNVWMNGCIWSIFIMCIGLGIIWVIGAIFGLVALSAAFLTVFGIGAILSALLFIAKVVIFGYIRRDRSQLRK